MKLKNKRSNTKRKASENDILQQEMEHEAFFLFHNYSTISMCSMYIYKLTVTSSDQIHQSAYLDGQACSSTIQVYLFLISLILVHS
jgi:hypothetical protein